MLSDFGLKWLSDWFLERFPTSSLSLNHCCLSFYCLKSGNQPVDRNVQRVRTIDDPIEDWPLLGKNLKNQLFFRKNENYGASPSRQAPVSLLNWRATSRVTKSTQVNANILWRSSLMKCKKGNFHTTWNLNLTVVTLYSQLKDVKQEVIRVMV